MKHIWTEDTGAGLHYWQLVNRYLFNDEYIVESKGSNQRLLDAVRNIDLSEESYYYIAFDIVYDNMDIMNKYLDLCSLADAGDGKIVLIDMTCFEYVILAFRCLIDLDQITDEKTLKYLMGFKHFSTERIMKSLVYELTDQKKWSVKGSLMGDCWYKDCCVFDQSVIKCGLKGMSGQEKIQVLLHDTETSRLVQSF